MKRADPCQTLPEYRPVASLPNKADLHLADFRLIKKLGEGAAGVVYLARQLSFDRDAAVKVLFKHVAGTPKHVERFYREARLAGRLDHPHIVQGYAVGEERGVHYFAMEYVDGQSLQAWLDQLGRLRLGDALHIVLAVAGALDYAHNQGLVHRDVKPGNVLIGRGGEVKVADLGMAKIRDEDLAALTRTGRGLGTPCYMPMEQFANAKEADARCDIYALGCMLHASLTGQPPFAAPSFLELIQAKEAGTFPPASKVFPEVPELLDLIIARMTARRADDRYQSCAEVIKALDGLGLANRGLRLAGVETPAAQVPGGAPGTIPAASPEAATVPSTPRLSPDIGNVWHISYTPHGAIQPVRRQLRTPQVLEWIGSPDFAPAATARRGTSGEDRPLAAYRELRPAVLDRVTQPAPGPEAAQPSGHPAKTGPIGRQREGHGAARAPIPVEAERTSQQSPRTPEPGPAAKSSWLGLACWLAAAGAVGVLVFCALRLLS
jgi:serine/threonine-protein kinase